MVCNLKQLIEICEKNIIDYNELIKKTYKKLFYNEDQYDFNFIITARGRSDFSKPLLESVIKSSKIVNKKIQFTLFEHSDKMEHEKTCEELQVNYLYLNSNGEVFNKCLSYNLSTLITNPSKWYIFHDLDCIVQKYFFKNLLENIDDETNAIQTFQKRRVLYLNEYLTSLVISNDIDIDDFNIDYDGVSLPQHIGAPGGSIAVKSELFYEVGGYDPEFFHSYAPEDIFFWDKLLCLTTIKLCENPPNEIYHMNHPILHHSNPDLFEMTTTHLKFNGLMVNKKLEFLNYKKNLLI